MSAASVLKTQARQHRYRYWVCRAHQQQAISLTYWKAKLKRVKLPTNVYNYSANKAYAHRNTLHLMKLAAVWQLVTLRSLKLLLRETWMVQSKRYPTHY